MNDTDRRPERPAARFESIEISLIRQINALGTPLSINLGIGEPNLEPDETIRALAREAASRGSWHYTPNAGLPALRDRIAATTGAADVEVCVTAGTQEALYAILQAFIDPGDEVLIPDPGFVSYPILVRLAGGIPVPYALEPPTWQIDIDRLDSLMTARCRAIILNSPSNPTGAVLDDRSIQSIAALAEKRGVLLVSDEVYREIFESSRPATFTGINANAIVVNGLSKSHSMTGLRLGWVICSPALMKPIVKAHQYIATCASAFSQQLALSIFEHTEWNRSWLDHVRTEFSTQRETAIAAIERFLGVAIAKPQGAFYALTPVPACDSIDLCKRLATDAAVLTIPGVAFGSRGEGFIRISYAASPETISAGIERIGRFLDDRDARGVVGR